MSEYECPDCGLTGELERFELRQAEAPDGTRYIGTVKCPLCGAKVKGE